jgi:flagellar hook-associated protein 2
VARERTSLAGHRREGRTKGRFGATMSDTSTIFTGTSRYSTDFQQIIDRSVAIASLSLLQLQSGKIKLDDQSTALNTLQQKFTALDSAIGNLESASGFNSYSLSNSDGTVAMSSLSAGAMAGVYTVQVIDIGSYSSAMSADDLPDVADPAASSISTASSFTLTVEGEEFTIEPAANTLSALVEAINAETDAEVEATIVNIGSPDAPDYRLSIRGKRLGDVDVQLNDGTRDLLTTLASGTLATYKVNGQPATAISTDTRTVTVAPGLSVTLLKAGTTDITLTRTTSSISNALSSLATAYNAALDQLDAHRGEEPGALAGNSILFTLSEAMHAMGGYSNAGAGIASLADLGLAFDDKGRLTLDTTVFASATDGKFEALRDFLGTSSTGGFLKHAADVMAGLTDDTDGVLPTSIDSIQSEITTRTSRIDAEQERIDTLERNLVAQMAAADALIASLEQEVNYITGLFEAMRIARESLK